MALPNIFSRRKRQAAASTEASDVYRYDEIPNKLRVQVVYIGRDGLGGEGHYASQKYWSAICEALRRELGRFHLTGEVYSQRDPEDEYCNWFLNEDDIESSLDGLEMWFRAIKLFQNDTYGIDKYDELVMELNARLLESSIGYQIESGEIVQMSSKFIHAEVVVPAINLISGVDYASANKEYLNAHKHFREGRFEESLVECGKSLESVLKVIGTKRKWNISENDAASKLISAAFSSNFIPTYMQAQFNSLRAMLESGVPTIRNKSGGHGAGTEIRTVDRHLAAFQLHQAAAAIVFLVEHEKAAP